MLALWVFTILFMAAIMLTGLSLLAMLVELWLHSVPFDWPPMTLNVKLRLRKTAEIFDTYRRFKRERGAPPLFLWTFYLSLVGVAAVSLAALVYHLVWGF